MVVTYDVRTADPEGARRLRKVAKVCLNYGSRVQNSVFECVVSPADYLLLKVDIIDIIDKAVDTVRFYQLGSNWENRIESFGVKRSFDFNEPIIL